MFEEIWDAVAAQTDAGSVANGKVDSGRGCGYLEVTVDSRRYRVQITPVEEPGDPTTDLRRERFLDEAQAMAKQGYDVRFHETGFEFWVQ